MTKILLDLFQFLKQPSFTYSNNKSFSQKWRDFIWLFIMTYTLKIVYTLTITNHIRKTFVVNKSSIIVQNEQSDYIFFLLAVIGYPILEELLFRYWLNRKKLLTLIIISATFLTASNLIFTEIKYSSAFVRSIVLLSNSLIILTIFFFYYFKLKATSKLDEVFLKLFPFLFYFSVLTFGFIHLLNFDLTTPGYWAIFLIVPFIISGITLGYVRIKYGMLYNISMHIAFNLITFILDKGFGL